MGQNTEKINSINLLYLDSPSLNKLLNVSLHFQKLSSIIGSNCTQSKIQNLTSLKRQLKNNRSEIVYFLAHSDKDKGMYIGENVNINGKKLAEIFPTQEKRLPKLVIFNTCYGVQSGLVEACLNEGIETVVASDKAVPIKGMCGYMETVFEGMEDKRKTLNSVVKQANKNFEKRNIEFITLKK